MFFKCELNNSNKGVVDKNNTFNNNYYERQNENKLLCRVNSHVIRSHDYCHHSVMHAYYSLLQKMYVLPIGMDAVFDTLIINTYTGVQCNYNQFPQFG